MSAICANGLDTSEESLYAMPMNRRFSVSAVPLLALCLLSCLVGCAGKRSGVSDQDRTKAHALVVQATQTLEASLKGDRGEALRQVVARARGVMIVLDMGSVGFLFSLDTGNGVLLARTDAGWTGPVFLTEASGGFGMQAGVTRMSGVFVYTDEADVRYMLESGGIFQGRAGVTVLNTNFKGKDTPKFVESGDVFFVGSTTGLYAGAGVHGGGLISRESLNRAYYGIADGDPEAILFKGASAPEDALALRDLLAGAATAGSSAAKDGTCDKKEKDGTEVPSK